MFIYRLIECVSISKEKLVDLGGIALASHVFKSLVFKRDVNRTVTKFVSIVLHFISNKFKKFANQ